MVEGRPLSESLADYREHLWENCKALWTIWVPAQLVNFSVVPLHLRIPFGEHQAVEHAAKDERAASPVGAAAVEGRTAAFD
jgi:hypothetical protein